MFKSLVLGLAVLGLVAGSAYAGGQTASGNFNVNTFDANGAIDGDFATIPNGLAGGISGAGGIAGTQAAGEVKTIRFWGRTISFGSTGADVTSGSTGLTVTDAGRWNNPVPGVRSIGVYSVSHNEAGAYASTDINAKGVAGAESTMFGAYAQGSLDVSGLIHSPRYFDDTKGFTGGIASQGSIGGFVGGSGVIGFGDVQIEAGLYSVGNSGSESYRFVDGNTEGMGTNVFANTTVTSYGNVDRSCIAFGAVEGGWGAAGGAASTTFQTANNGSGVAKASAVGTYVGAGSLGDNFTGSAVGYTSTNITVIPGLKGSSSQSAAGMQVSTSGRVVTN